MTVFQLALLALSIVAGLAVWLFPVLSMQCLKKAESNVQKMHLASELAF